MKLVESKPVSLVKVKELLEKRKADNNGAELGYEQANSLEYADKFAQLTPAKMRDAVEEFSKVDGINEEGAIALADLLPKKEDEAKVILQAYKIEVADDAAKEIVKIAKKYRK